MSAVSRGWTNFLVILFLLVVCSSDVKCVAVMSVDIGAEWMKVAIVSPGVPMEIALNKESKRKTPVAVAFRDNERTFGEDALNVGVRFPPNCYSYFLDLLGKDVSNPVVKTFQKRFPYYNIIPDPVRNTVLFKHDNETVYSPDELIAMLLVKAKEFAEDSAMQPVNDVVLTVPSYFNQIERRALIVAAEIAGLKVLQLINDYTAAALNYGIFRRKDFNETAQYVMLYDMGAYSTAAVIASYQVVKTKEKGFVESNPQLSIVGIGYDRTLGGLEMQLRLRDFLAKKFNELKKTKKNVFDHPRAMAKLFKEAGRLKIILSANIEFYAQVENLIDDIDFKQLVTREQFENICKDLIARVKGPVEQALKTSQLSLEIINQVILVGAGTRVPAVQEQLMAVVKTDLSKNLNTDEAAVLGAAYKAADLSTGFKVKKFITKDAVLYPIQVTFERADSEKEAKLVSRTLFNLMNPYPQKKILTFNKHQQDFEFTVHYGDVESILPEHEVKAVGSKKLHKIVLSGVSEAIKKHQEDDVEPKGIKAHFNLDESGLLTMTSVEYYVEKTVTVDAQEDDEQSAFSKLSSTFSKLFQAADDELKDTNADLGKAPQKEDDSKEQIKPVKEEPEGKKVNDTGGSFENKTETETKTNTTTSKEETEKKPKIVVLKVPINSSVKYLTVTNLSGDQLQESVNKINALNEYDIKKVRQESALNALESTIIDTRSKIENEEFSSFAKSEEAELIDTKSLEIANWLEEEGYTAEADVLENKLEELKKLVKPVQARYKEYVDRPDAIKSLDVALNSTSLFLSTMKNITEQLNLTLEDPKYSLYTPVELRTLEKLINETTIWKETTIKQQETLARSQDPVLSTKSINEKVSALNREVTYFASKSKNWVPPASIKPGNDKVKKSKSKKKKGKADANSKEEKEETKEGKPVFEEEDETVQDAEQAEATMAPVEDTTEKDKHIEL